MTTPSTYKLGYPGLKYSMVPGVKFTRDPTTSDLTNPTVGGFYEIPTIWVNQNTTNAFIFTGVTNGTTAVWAPITLSAEGAVAGPASATDNALARFDGATGKVIQNSPVTMADITGTMTFPAGGHITLTAGGAAAVKGSGTLVAGTVTIATTAALTGTVIVAVVTTLGTVTTVKALSVTITNGVSFTVTSSDPTDTSTFLWAIVG